MSRWKIIYVIRFYLLWSNEKTCIANNGTEQHTTPMRWLRGFISSLLLASFFHAKEMEIETEKRERCSQMGMQNWIISNTFHRYDALKSFTQRDRIQPQYASVLSSSDAISVAGLHDFAIQNFRIQFARTESNTQRCTCSFCQRQIFTRLCTVSDGKNLSFIIPFYHRERTSRKYVQKCIRLANYSHYMHLVVSVVAKIGLCTLHSPLDATYCHRVACSPVVNLSL